MIVYSGTKSRFRQDVMTNDIGNIIPNDFHGATSRHTDPLSLERAGLAIPKAEGEEFMVVAEVVGKCE